MTYLTFSLLTSKVKENKIKSQVEKKKRHWSRKAVLLSSMLRKFLNVQSPLIPAGFVWQPGLWPLNNGQVPTHLLFVLVEGGR